MPKLSLDPEAIRRTSLRLSKRTHERFPGSGLSARSIQLTELSERAATRAGEIAQPVRWVRALYVVLGVLVIVGIAVVPIDLSTSVERDAVEWVQVFEAAINDIVLLGAGIVFLATLETRIKRRRALNELHELRSFAHIIDMHQLTKDPQRIKGSTAHRTAASPSAELTPYELGRYLDYCSELLSLCSKVAALYVQDFPDAPTIATVTEIEQLCTDLSRKIWQKLMILTSTHPEAAPTA